MSEEVSDFLERYIFQQYGSVIKISDDFSKKNKKMCMFDTVRKIHEFCYHSLETMAYQK